MSKETSFRPGVYAVFENPSNGHQDEVPALSHLWMAFFGLFYLIATGLWPQLAGMLFGLFLIFMFPWVGLPAAFILWVVFALRAPFMIIANYQRRGWQQVI